MATSIIAFPLMQRISNDETALQRVIITLKTDGRPFGEVRTQFYKLVHHVLEENPERTEQHILSTGIDPQPYAKARLQGRVIKRLVELDQEKKLYPTSIIAEIRTDVSDERYFDPDNLVRTVISIPMLNDIQTDENMVQSVMIEINVNYPKGRSEAKKRVIELITNAIANNPTQDQFVSQWKSDTSEQYVYAKLTGTAIREIVKLDQNPSTDVKGTNINGTDVKGEDVKARDAKGADAQGGNDKAGQDCCAIYHVWPDFKLRAQIWCSAPTVKADACRRSFATTGRGIVWAVLDSGIDSNHPHFEKHSNLIPPSGLAHMDFTGPNPVEVLPKNGLTDDYGHGTHVAGIIAGELNTDTYEAISLYRERDESGKISYRGKPVGVPVIGVAAECKLLSYKVLDKRGEGDVSTVIAAIQKIQELNGYGRHILVHGVNMSLGYDFDPEWFACGQSPICVEVNRLVRSGLMVVIAAGNTGKGFALTINDPGNAELALTVGATHRDMPHLYGVSYFSSKGPTGDGRAKPDVLAPGERIISCGAGPDLETYKSNAGVIPTGNKRPAYYLERSGTSMAAPHVSGIVAGILSTRGEFVGLPEEVKGYIIKNATDLGRERNFQGGGLVDMMRTIQAM
jgi:subtilisin family serine protease